MQPAILELIDVQFLGNGHCEAGDVSGGGDIGSVHGVDRRDPPRRHAPRRPTGHADLFVGAGEMQCFSVPHPPIFGSARTEHISRAHVDITPLCPERPRAGRQRIHGGAFRHHRDDSRRIPVGRTKRVDRQRWRGSVSSVTVRAAPATEVIVAVIRITILSLPGPLVRNGKRMNDTCYTPLNGRHAELTHNNPHGSNPACGLSPLARWRYRTTHSRDRPSRR